MKAKRLSVSVVVLITISILAVSSYAEIIPEAVVGIWLFDEDGGDIAKDSSGNGHDGMIEGNVKWANGKFKSSLQFPGESGQDRVIVQSDSSMKLAEWTIVAWIKIGTTGAEQMFVVKSGPDQAMRNYACSVNPSLLQAQFAHKSRLAGGGYQEARGKISLIDDEWHHIAATYDKETLRAYVDGVADGEKAIGTEPLTSDGSLVVGCHVDGRFPVKGIIDDVGVFNQALTEDDIKNIMENGLESMALFAVSSAGKLAITWAKVKI